MRNAHVDCSQRYVTEMITATAHQPNSNRLRSSARTTDELPVLHRKIGERAFSYSEPVSWYILPSDVSSNMDTTTFRAHLKTHLLGLPMTFNLLLCELRSQFVDDSFTFILA